MRKIFLTLMIQMLMLPMVWADQAAYVQCKQQALNNLATRYNTYFQSETGASGVANTTNTFMNDYNSAISQNCAAQYPDTSSKDYLNCVDGAVNSASTRFSTQFTTKINTSGTTKSQDTFQAYQTDYNNAEIACRAALTDGNSCAASHQAVVQSCTSASSDAATSCDVNRSPDLANMTSSINGITSSGTGGVQSACQAVSNMGDQGTQAVNAYSASCSGKKSTCLTKCQQALRDLANCQNVESNQLYQSAHTSYDSCSILQAKTAEAQQMVQQLQTAKTSALNCSNQTGSTGGSGTASAAGTSGTGTNNQQDPTTQALAGLTQAAMAALNQPAASPSPVDPSQIPSTDPNSPYCQAHPTLASCVANCSRTDLPAIANSHTCICFRNPNDASCGGATASSLATESLGSQGGGISPSATAASTGPDLNGLDGGFQGFANQGRGAGPSEEIGGKQGNGAGIGGGSGIMPGGNPLSGGGSGGAADIPHVASGYYGGGGGSGGSFSNGVGGGGGGGGAGSGSGGSANAAGANPKTPDLRQFLPGGKMDPTKRGIAGMSGPDGITGPEVENWNKIQTRYRFIESSLLP